MQSTTIVNKSNNLDLYNSYRSDVEQFIKMASDSGVQIKTGNEAAWNQFLLLPPHLQQAIANNFRVYKEVAEEVIREKESITNSLQFAWRMFNRLGLTPPAELFELITNDDVIEIHLPEFTQIFRNLNFFKVTSYTFEELMHYPFFELFSRENQITETIIQEFVHACSGEVRMPFMSKAPEHIGQEIKSEEKISAKIKQKVMCPLFDKTGKVTAVFSTIDIKVIQN